MRDPSFRFTVKDDSQGYAKRSHDACLRVLPGLPLNRNERQSVLKIGCQRLLHDCNTTRLSGHLSRTTKLYEPRLARPGLPGRLPPMTVPRGLPPEVLPRGLPAAALPKDLPFEGLPGDGLPLLAFPANVLPPGLLTEVLPPGLLAEALPRGLAPFVAARGLSTALADAFR